MTKPNGNFIESLEARRLLSTVPFVNEGAVPGGGINFAALHAKEEATAIAYDAAHSATGQSPSTANDANLAPFKPSSAHPASSLVPFASIFQSKATSNASQQAATSIGQSDNDVLT